MPIQFPSPYGNPSTSPALNQIAQLLPGVRNPTQGQLATQYPGVAPDTALSLYQDQNIVPNLGAMQGQITAGPRQMATQQQQAPQGSSLVDLLNGSFNAAGKAAGGQ